MTATSFRIPRCLGNRQAGQTTTIVAMVLGLFLLGMAGLAVDVSNWWFHRQMAQGAADAACTAGVMDLLGNASSGGAFGNFPAGSPPASFLCSGASTTAACKYAALNGYPAGGLVANTPSNDVKISFPGSVPGMQTCSTTVPPPCVPATTTVANPFILVNVFDRVPTTFTGIITGKHTMDVATSAVCGVLQSTAPVPIIVMNPTCQHAFELSGSTTVKIAGGPTRSIEVNSSNLTCAAATGTSQCDASGTIDLSKGGPNFTGGDFAVVGQPKSAPGNFIPGTTGHWSSGGPISDPYALVSAPSVPAQSPTDDGFPIHPNQLNTYAGYVAHNVDGCPDGAGCIEYQPGLYQQSIVVKGYTAIFVPGIYYFRPTSPNIDTENGGSPGTGCLASNGPFNNTRDALAVDSSGVVRPSTALGDGSKGVVFYLTGASGAGSYASVFFGSNAGSSGGRSIDPFQTSTITCDGSALPTQLNVPATVTGDVLLGQCTAKGTYFGAGSTDTLGSVRGLVFFQDRANADTHGQPSMQGGGGLVFAGNLYFHNCNSSGTGTNCSQPNTGYQAFYQLQGLGNPGSGQGTYFLGNVTTDELILNGGGTLAMSLNPNAVYNILKASLLE
jgi:Putative Flp pilus-assembly TadE/G-like